MASPFFKISTDFMCASFLFAHVCEFYCITRIALNVLFPNYRSDEIMLIAAGPSRIMKITGNMKTTVGSMILIGAFAACA